MQDVLPWLNLLLVPIGGLVLRITVQLATLQAVQREHERRLNSIQRIST